MFAQREKSCRSVSWRSIAADQDLAKPRAIAHSTSAERALEGWFGMLESGYRNAVPNCTETPTHSAIVIL